MTKAVQKYCTTYIKKFYIISINERLKMNKELLRALIFLKVNLVVDIYLLENFEDHNDVELSLGDYEAIDGYMVEAMEDLRLFLQKVNIVVTIEEIQEKLFEKDCVDFLLSRCID